MSFLLPRDGIAALALSCLSWSATAAAAPPSQVPRTCATSTQDNVAPNNGAPGIGEAGIHDVVVHVLPSLDAVPRRDTVASADPVTYEWGPATWLEPSMDCASMSQVLEFWSATGGDLGTPRPTIVYFHPSGTTYRVWRDSVLYANLVLPATAAGYNFVSAEFRHPVADQYLAPKNKGRLYQHDAGLAIQYLRAHAAALAISTNNVFAFGYSRGSLALWEALQPDLGGGTTGQPSSRVSAFVGYQAQSTYKCQQFSRLFLLPDDPLTPVYVQDCKNQNPQWSQFRSAIDSVTADSVPVRLQYEQAFNLVAGSTVRIQRVSPPWLTANYDAVHYPDFGIALYNAYRRAGNTRIEYPQDLVPQGLQFVGWQAFIQPLVQPDAR
jgi:acetyl esterase/lipase